MRTDKGVRGLENVGVNEWACVLCRRTYAKNQPEQICSDCRRFRAIGVIVSGVTATLSRADYYADRDQALQELDAIAELLGVATRLRRQHNREMRDEQFGAQRDANLAYYAGKDEGRRLGEEW